MESPKPIAWSKLPEKLQDEYFGLARRIARRESKRLEDFGEGILGIAPGLRSKTKRSLIRDELVIRFSVREKWTRTREEPVAPNAQVPIPPYLSTWVRRGKQRHEVRIPTDVVEVGGFELQRTYLRIGDGTEVGSTTALLRGEQGRLYILSCNHVLGLCRQTEECKGSKGLRIDQVMPDALLVARIARKKDLGPMFPDSNAFSLDAAIALVPPSKQGAVSSTINGERATKVMRPPARVRLGDVVTIPARKKTYHARVTEVGTSPVRLPYTCNGRRSSFTFRRVIKYRTKTVCGDSGAPVLLGSSLVGMHIGLAGSEGIALFADDVIRRTTFGQVLRLEPNHNND